MDKMREYFTKRSDERKSGRIRDQEVGSPAGLALYLGISASELRSYEGGSEEENVFYQEFLTRYEILCDGYCADRRMTATQRQNLDETLFSRAGGDDVAGIHLVFPKWTAPDDYEHFIRLKELCEAGGISLNKARDIIKEYIGDMT